jgi:hypothetical protein
MTMFGKRLQNAVLLPSILALSLGLGTSATCAADHGGRYLYRISRPNGIVMVVELYGYELDDAEACQEEAYQEALDDWDYEARIWADVVKSAQYPVPKPVKPQVRRLEDLTGKGDKERGAARDKHRAELDDWNVCAITDLHGNTSARAIRSDYMLRARIIEMTMYASAMVSWTEPRARLGDDAAGKPPEKPVLKTVAKNLKSAADAQKRVGEVNAEIAAVRQKKGEAAPDANPPTAVKAERVQWPGLMTIYHGSNWQGDETFVTAIKDANYGASGCAAWQIDHCAKRGLHAFVFLWAHEAGTIPAKYRDDDAVLCYYLGDRIPPGKWGTWAALEAAAYRGDPHHPAVFSMSPRAWGGIEVYFPIVRGRAVEYYHYHWDGGRAPQNHFVYLELYRQHSARQGNVPIIRLLETRAEDMRKTSQTVFTCLAYGVRGFQYGGGLFDGNQRDERGVPTRNHLGEAAAKINKAIKAFSPVFKRAQNVDVFQTPPLPPFAKEAPADYWVRPSGANVVLGVFADRYDHYLVLANRDAFNAHEATLHFAEQGLQVTKMNKETAKWEELVLKPGEDGRSSVTIPMEQAGGELLRVVGHYLPPVISGPARFIRKGTVRITCHNPAGAIRYTLDGSPTTKKSAVYEEPLEISATSKVRAIFVHKSGRATAPVEATFTKVAPRKADGKTLGPGVAYEYYEGAWPKLPSFDELKPVVRGICDKVTLDVRRREQNYALRFSGYLEIKTAGSYTFSLGSDDGSRLLIDGKMVIDVDGIHGVITKEQAVELEPGMHRVDVLYMQGQHGYDLKLDYEGPEVSRAPLSLWCEQ